MVQKMRKMKDSGIEWIGEIPEGWEITKIKHIVSSVTDTDHFMPDSAEFGIPYLMIGDLKDLSSSIDWDSSKKISIEDYKKLSIKSRPQIGDIIFARYASIGTTCYIDTDRDFLVSYACLTIHPSDLIIGKFLSYYLKSSSFAEDVLRRTNSNTQGNVGKDSLVNATIVLPSIIEQTQIVNFLDAKCSDINAMLSKTRSSIEEYKKLKQAVITQAVTKGVRGERKMKDSGVAWIGEIPVEWRKTQLRHCATIKSGITLGKSYSKDTVLIERPYLRVANVQGGYVDLNDLATIEVTPDEDLKYRLHSGDVLMTEGGDRDKLGRGCVWHGEIEPCLHQNHVFAVQTNETILLPEFLEYLTASDVGRSYFDVTAIKTTNLACTSSSKVLAFTIPLPPIEEQIEIVSFIKEHSLELNKLIMKKGLLVQELENYKKSLIYEVVTGKREV
jgi:type I restriction enzyme S subunit